MSFHTTLLHALVCFVSFLVLEHRLLEGVEATHIPDWKERLQTPYDKEPCESNADCMYLGECVAGVCKCDPGFKGSHCHELDLLPTERDWGFNDPLRPSWGGTVLRQGNKYVLFASYVQNQCDIAEYGTNSAVLRAEASVPQGPYKYMSTVLPPFHHGTVAIQGDDGKIYIYHDGKDIPSRFVHNCIDKKTPRGMPQRVVLTSSMKSGLFKFGDSPQDYMSVSIVDPNSWNRTDEVVILKSNVRAGIACNRTNPSPLVMEDGSVLLALRTTFCSPEGRPACDYRTNCQHIYLVKQKHPLDPISEGKWQLVKQLEASEDPFLWKDARGQFHMLVHSKRACGLHDSSGCVLLASSKDSIQWKSAKRPALRGIVAFRDTGKTEKASLLQRPKILFDEDGTTPLFFICGFRRRPQSRVYTLFVPFNVPANEHLRDNKLQVHESESAPETEPELVDDGGIQGEDKIIQGNVKEEENTNENVREEASELIDPFDLDKVEIRVVDEDNKTNGLPEEAHSASPSSSPTRLPTKRPTRPTYFRSPTESPTYFDVGVLPVDIVLPEDPNPKPEKTIHDQPVRYRTALWGLSALTPQTSFIILAILLCVGFWVRRRLVPIITAYRLRSQYGSVSQSPT